MRKLILTVGNCSHDAQFAQNSQLLQIFRRIVRRGAPVMPPICHFEVAGCPADAAEMTLIRRMAWWMPLLCNLVDSQ